MHIEKNYFDNLFNTVMNVTGKTKDNAKARLDLEEYCRRVELHLQESTNNKVLKPKVSYTFTIEQKRKICEWVQSLEMPDGYSSNLEKKVDMVHGILHGMKSHDCHIFMEQLISIAFSGLLERIWKPMAQISLFFKELCSSTLTVENLTQMEADIVVITNKLEKILPPGFFDVMEHLPVHLVHEARLGGPVQTRWMYPFERTIGKCKRGVKNKSSVEGSIVEAYLVRETFQFCSYYFDDQVLCLRNRPNGHQDDGDEPPLEPLSIFNQPGICAKKQKFRTLTRMEQKAATLHVLLNCPEVLPFLDLFVSEFGETQVHESFATWYFNWVFKSANFTTINQFLKDISLGPVEAMSHYTVNGFKFTTEEYSKHRKTNNNGVWVKGEDDVDYFGVLQEILNMEFAGLPMKKIILFRCKWYDPTPRGTRKLEEHDINEVKHTRTYRAYDPFIIAQNAKQVYYAP